MAETTPTQTEPQRPAQAQAPQQMLEKTPWQNQQPMQFIPIAPGQHQQQPLLQPPGGDDEELPFGRSWYIAKIILGSLSLVTSTVIWALCIVILARYTNINDSYSDSFQITFEAAFALSAAGLAIIWQAAEFLTVWADKKRRGIHPGAHVGLHLIIWLVAVTLVGFLAAFLSWDLEQLAEIQDGSGGTYYSYSGASYSYDAGAFARLVRYEEALLAFMVVLLVVHFALFVGACVETHRVNSYPVTRTVYVQVPVPGAGAGAPLPGQQLLGYYAYQPLPGQPMPFAQPQMQTQRPPQGQGAPAPPQRAHMYGYYAPAPAFPPQASK